MGQPVPVVPVPRESHWLPGEFRVQGVDHQLRWHGRPDSVAQAQLLQSWQQAGGKLTIMAAPAAPVQIGLFSDSLLMAAWIAAGLLQSDSIGQEGYQLSVRPEGILLGAESATGLFYGVQTLRQLLRAYSREGRLPAITITDYPDFPFRGIMDDISRGPIPNGEFMREQIRRLAALKFNYFTFYIEHTVRTESHPGFAVADAITIDEWRELSEFAADHHMRLIGAFQSLGHARNVLAHPEYAPLGHTDRMFKPADTAVVRFLKDIYREMIPAFNAPYFNINCDEAYDLGYGHLKPVADSIGIGNIYLGHVRPLLQFIIDRGRRPMLWGDILMQHPSIVDSLPRATVILPWSYGPDDDFAALLDPVAGSGHEFIICPGILNSNRIFPDYRAASDNIRNFAMEGRKRGARGMLTTVWDDGGDAWFSLDWYGVAFAADQSWQPEDEAFFEERLAGGSLGPGGEELVAAIRTLGSLSELAPTAELDDRVFRQQIVPRRGQTLGLDTAQWRAVARVAGKADSLLGRALANLRQPASWLAADAQAWQLVAGRLRGLAATRFELLAAADAYRNMAARAAPPSVPEMEQLTASVKNLEVYWRSILQLFESRWAFENRPYWKEQAAAPIQEMLSGLQQLQQALAGLAGETGAPLPPTEAVGLGVYPLNEPSFTYWLISGPFFGDGQTGRQRDFLHELGGENLARPTPVTYFNDTDGVQRSWTKWQSLYPDRVDLASLVSSSRPAVAYAYCRIESPQEANIPAVAEGAAVSKLIFNGETIASGEENGGRVMLPFQRGRNHLLIKLLLAEGHTTFSVKLPGFQVRNSKYKYELFFNVATE